MKSAILRQFEQSSRVKNRLLKKISQKFVISTKEDK